MAQGIERAPVALTVELQALFFQNTVELLLVIRRKQTVGKTNEVMEILSARKSRHPVVCPERSLFDVQNGTWFVETIRASGLMRRANRPDTRPHLTKDQSHQKYFAKQEPSTQDNPDLRLPSCGGGDGTFSRRQHTLHFSLCSGKSGHSCAFQRNPVSERPQRGTLLPFAAAAQLPAFSSKPLKGGG